MNEGVTGWDRLMGAKDYFLKPLGTVEYVAVGLVAAGILAIAVYIVRAWWVSRRADDAWDATHTDARRQAISRALERDTVRTRPEQQAKKPKPTVESPTDGESFDSPEEPGLHSIVKEKERKTDD